MCGCSVKITDEKNIEAGTIGIPLRGIVSDNFASNLKWAYCINPDKVTAAFKKSTGLDISIANFSTLINGNANGNDVKIYKVNFNDILKKIIFTKSEREKASCQVNFTVPNLNK